MDTSRRTSVAVDIVIHISQHSGLHQLLRNCKEKLMNVANIFLKLISIYLFGSHCAVIKFRLAQKL